MEIVISGYGKMGKAVEQILKQREHNLLTVIDSVKDFAELYPQKAVCIDFSTPDAFKENYKTLADNFDAVIVGTTGWDEIAKEVLDYFKTKNKSLVYASNFSLGVNIYFETLEYISGLISDHANYEPYIIELHHKEKLDKPSGTALSIQEILKSNLKKEPEISSLRCGYIKGIHETGFESEYDKITLRHEAYSREGFALGAVIAAEWLAESPGVWKFNDLLKSKLLKK